MQYPSLSNLPPDADTKHLPDFVRPRPYTALVPKLAGHDVSPVFQYEVKYASAPWLSSSS